MTGTASRSDDPALADEAPLLPGRYDKRIGSLTRRSRFARACSRCAIHSGIASQSAVYWPNPGIGPHHQSLARPAALVPLVQKRVCHLTDARVWFVLADYRTGRPSVETETMGAERGERPDGAAIDNIISALPLTTYRAGETVLTAGAKTGRLLILKKGAVVIRKDSVEIARVEQPGAVVGELSALLNQPHAADVLAVADAQFYVADAALLGRDPIVLFYVAQILAHRLVAADICLVELKKEVQFQTGQSAGALKRMIAKVEQVLQTSSTSFSPGL
jgi:hypothetical protein